MAQVCVIGTPTKWGEAVTAVIVLRPGSPGRRGVGGAGDGGDQSTVKERKGSVQSPKRVIVVDSVAGDRAGQAGQEGRAGTVLEGAGRAVSETT